MMSDQLALWSDILQAAIKKFSSLTIDKQLWVISNVMLLKTVTRYIGELREFL